jgi:hypothetical protein
LFFFVVKKKTTHPAYLVCVAFPVIENGKSYEERRGGEERRKEVGKGFGKRDKVMRWGFSRFRSKISSFGWESGEKIFIFNSTSFAIIREKIIINNCCMCT